MSNSRKKLEGIYRKRKQRQENRNGDRITNNYWSFLEKLDNATLDFEKVKEFPRIGTELFKGFSTDLQPFMDRVLKYVRTDSLAKGYPENSYLVSTFRSVYGVPGNLITMRNFNDHVQNSVNFLQRSLEGLMLPEETVIVAQKGDYVNNPGGKIFLTNVFYDVWRIQVTNGSDARVNYHFETITRKFCGEYEPLNSAIYLSCCPEAIVSPMSESLHFSTAKRKDEFKTSCKVDNLLLDQLDESYVEATSYFLTRQMLIKNDQSHKLKEVDAVHERMGRIQKDRYLYVPHARQWIESLGSEGIQRAYDLYMEDPAKFGKAIGTLNLNNT